MLTTATDAAGLWDVISCTELIPVVTWLAEGTRAMLVGLRTTDSIGAYGWGGSDDTIFQKYTWLPQQENNAHSGCKVRFTLHYFGTPPAKNFNKEIFFTWNLCRLSSQLLLDLLKEQRIKFFGDEIFCQLRAKYAGEKRAYKICKSTSSLIIFHMTKKLNSIIIKLSFDSNLYGCRRMVVSAKMKQELS
jgi:hypothetical protein